MQGLTTTKQLDVFFKTLFNIEAWEDISLNGLQVDNDGAEIGKIAFAVDACMETFERTALAGASMLFTHHGLFWGKPLALNGAARSRLKFLLDNNIALYAVHLPLDQHPRLGNNAVLAKKLEMENVEPFGLYHGNRIGFKGTLKKPLSVDEAVQRVGFMNRPPLSVLPFGAAESRTAAVVSGGAADMVHEALAEGIDLFVTGESSHSCYHYALEEGINVIAAGHYNSEVWGVRAVMEYCVNELFIDAEFIDAPTGL
ncbi:MAG: Nif3-like dinuclear metal center hexameric protein [Treponema sp.]|jgi:dinuclear metal center YbgI/SA1388 family protein|nr:Nif3-like dinuclear metal center hexameric protein [Treponema sp.]